MPSKLYQWSAQVFYAAALVLCLFSLPAFAQSNSSKATIAGTVIDAAEAAVPGAKLQLEPLAITVVSDDQGAFRLPEVPAGKWFKRFSGFTVCGEGEFVKTFLLSTQAAGGYEIA